MKEQNDETIVREQKMPDNAARIHLPDKNRGKVVRDYQREIYSDRIGTVVREITSNAIDAHDDADTDRNVVIDLKEPSGYFGENTQKLFVVQDFGKGMSHSFMMNEFVQYRTSTKNHSNELIGGYGIGSKSPLGYRNSFLAEVVHEGADGTRMKRRYILERHQDDDYIVPISEEQTDDPTGTKITIPINDGDVSDFKTAICTQLPYFADRIDFQGVSPDVTLPDAVVEGPGFRYNEDGVLLPHTERTQKFGHRTRIDKEWTGLHAVMGGVPYSIDTSEIDCSYQLKREPIALFFDIGELKLNLSREQIRYTDEAVEKIETRIQEIIDQLDQTIEEELLGYEPNTIIQQGMYEYALAKKDKFDNLPFAASGKGIEALKLRDKFESYSNTFKSPSWVMSGTLKKIKGSSSQSYTISEVGGNHHKKRRLRRLKRAAVSGDPVIYLSTMNNDTARNRYLADKHSKCYVLEWKNGNAASEETKKEKLFQYLKDNLPSYDDLDFDRSKYNSAHASGEIPAYTCKKHNGNGNFERDYEQVSYIRSENPHQYVTMEEYDGDKEWDFPFSKPNAFWVYGNSKEEPQLGKMHMLSRFLPRRYRFKVVRVSKKNARKVFTQAHHKHVSEMQDWKREVYEWVARQNYLKEKVTSYSWFEEFNRAEELRPLYWLYAHAEKHVGFGPLLNRRHVIREAKRLADKDESSVEPDYSVPREISKPLSRLKRYNKSLRAAKTVLENTRHDDGMVMESLISLVKPRVRRMKDVEKPEHLM